MAQGARDDDGYETVSGFFKSPAATTAYAPSSVGASSPATAKKRAPASTSAAAAAAASASAARSMPSPEPDDDFDHHQFGGEGFGDEDESDMQLDDGSSLTPSAFQRKHKAHLPPSALRHSVTAGAGASASPKSVSRRPPVVDSESEEEAPVNKKVVGGRKSVGGKGGLSMLGASAKGKGKARVTAPISDSDDDDDDEQDEDEAVPIVVNKKTAASKGKAINGRLAHLATNGSGGSNASSRSGRSSRRESIGSPLLKLGKGGKPVAAAFKKDVKGKGKQVVRSDSEPEEERDESVEMEQFDFPEPDQDDDQDEEEEEEESEEEEAPRPRANGKGKAPRVSNASTASSAPSPRKGSQASKKASTSQQAKKKAPAAEPIRKRVRSDSEEDPDGGVFILGTLVSCLSVIADAVVASLSLFQSVDRRVNAFNPSSTGATSAWSTSVVPRAWVSKRLCAFPSLLKLGPPKRRLAVMASSGVRVNESRASKFQRRKASTT